MLVSQCGEWQLVKGFLEAMPQLIGSKGANAGEVSSYSGRITVSIR